MDFLPLFHNIKNRRCVVVGAGSIALRKIRPLIEAGAIIDIVAPDIDRRIQDLAKKHSIRISTKPFENNDLKDACLVISATNKKRLISRYLTTLNP